MSTDSLKKGNVLDELDRKILYYHDLDCRQPISKIAKLVNSNRSTVRSRLARLVDSGVINHFSTLISPTQLGFYSIKVYLQFHNMDKNVEEKFYEYLESIKQVGIIVTCSGRWNAYFAIRTRSPYTGHTLIMEILSKYDEYILHKEIINNIDIFFCNRKWLLKDAPPPITVKNWGRPGSIQLDETDINILKLLIEDGRMPVIGIAKKTGQPSQNIINRIRRLEKKNVINQYYLLLNYTRMGVLHCKVFVYLQKATPDKLSELISYCENQPSVRAIVKTLGTWDMEITFEVDAFEQMLSVMDDIRIRFKDIIKNYDPIMLTRQSLIRFPEE